MARFWQITGASAYVLCGVGAADFCIRDYYTYYVCNKEGYLCFHSFLHLSNPTEFNCWSLEVVGSVFEWHQQSIKSGDDRPTALNEAAGEEEYIRCVTGGRRAENRIK